MTYSIKQALFDVFGKGAYLLAADASTSAVWYSDDIYPSLPVWVKGTPVIDVYTVMRETMTPDTLLIYSPYPSSVGSATILTTFDPGGYAYTLQLGTLATGGNPGNCIDGGGGTHATEAEVRINLPVVSTVINVKIDWKKFHPGHPTGNCNPIIKLYDAGNNLLSTYTSVPTAPDNTWVTADYGVVSVANVAYAIFNVNASAAFNVQVWMDNCSITYITSTGQANVQVSTDRGQTFSSLQSVGTVPTGNIGGFDIQLAGSVSMAAMAGKVRKAATIGGAYADFINTTGANPVCLIVPWYTRNSTTVKNTTGATPDCVVALDGADTDGGSLYWVDGDGTKHDITPTAGMTFDNPNCITTSYGTHIVVFGKVGGVYHLYTSINGGTSWTDRGVLTTPHFIRTRRKDTRAKAGGNTGQIYVTNGNPIDYSRDWAASLHPRTMPTTGVLGLDIAG